MMESALSFKGSNEALSILFVVGKWGIGGVERVTIVLANAFIARGWRVAVAAFGFDDRSLLSGSSDKVEVVEIGGTWFSRENQRKLAAMIRRRQVDFVINQWCLPYRVTRFLNGAMKGTSAKLIAVHHNQPDRNRRLADARNAFSRFAWRTLTRLDLRLVYADSDAYVVLSRRYVEILRRFISLGSSEKIHVIANPLTLNAVSECSKENVILYVGRLEESQKRVSRTLSTWAKIACRLPDWRLEIVGDGPDRLRYEDMAKGMERISFLGSQNPSASYAKSKILLLTSDFEGFPLVLAEAMAHGCVPVVHDGFPAANDIIRGQAGKLTPPPFSEDMFAEEVLELAANEEEWLRMSRNARTAAGDFSISSIVAKWEHLFHYLNECQEPCHD